MKKVLVSSVAYCFFPSPSITGLFSFVKRSPLPLIGWLIMLSFPYCLLLPVSNTMALFFSGLQSRVKYVFVSKKSTGY